MPYQGSTQSIGFRNRAVPNSSKRMKRKAKDLEQQRIDEVNSLTRQASGQITEMQRIDSVQSKKEAYELEKLRDFSSSINNFLDTAAKEVGKEYIAQKRQEGIDRARAAAAGDEEALAEVKLNDKQIKEIEDRIEEQKRATTAAGDKFDAKAAKASLEDKYRSENIRKLGSNVAWGYRRGMLIEASKGYDAYRSSMLLPQTNEKGERIDPFIPGTDKRVGDYDNLTREEQNKALGFIERQYIVENSAGLSENVVSKYLTASVVKQTDEFKQQEHQRYVVEQAQKEHDELVVNLKTASETSDTNPEGVTAAVQAIINRNPSIQRRLGVRGAVGAAAKKDLIAQIVEAGSHLKGGEELSDFLEVLENGKFNIPGLGTKTLSEHWPGDFDIVSIRGDAMYKQSQRIAKIQNALNTNLKVQIAELQNQRRDGVLSSTDYKIAIKGLEEEFGAATSWNAAYGEAIDFTPKTMTIEQSKSYMRYLKKKYNTQNGGKIPPSKLDKVHDDVLKENRAYIDDNPIHDHPVAVEELGKAQKQISNAMDGLAGQLSTYDRDKNDINRAKVHALQKVTSIATLLRAEDPDMSWEAAIQKATEQVELDIDRHASSHPEHDQRSKDYETDENGLFTKFQPKDTIGDINSRTAKAQRAIERTEDLVVNSSKDVISTTAIIKNPVLLEVSQDASGNYGRPKAPLYRLAKLDPLDRTVYEIVNLQRKANGLPEIKWDKNTQDFIDIHNAATPNIRRDIASGDGNRISRAVDAMNFVDLRTIHNTILGPNGETPITTDELPTLLAEAGMPAMTHDEFLNDSKAQQRLTKFKVNKLMKIAATKTDNKVVMVRMVATGMRFGEDRMDQWNNEGEEDKYSLGAYNGYLSGNTDNVPKEGYGDAVVPTVLPSENNLESEKGRLKALEGEGAPEASITIDKDYGIYKRNPAYTKYKQDKQKLEDSITIKEYLAKDKPGDLGESAFTHVARIKRIIGNKRYTELYTKAHEMPGTFKTNFDALLRQEPQFSGGVTNE